VSERLRQASTYTLKPTPEQERQLEQTVWRCRVRSNTALAQRKTAYERCGVTLSASQQQAELPDLQAAFPVYAEMHSQVLQDVLRACLRRVRIMQGVGVKGGGPHGATSVSQRPE
jgi:putative transposase